MMDTLIKKGYGVMDVKPEQTGGRKMRLLTALAGVLALAAVTVSGATIEELKTQYQNDPTSDKAVETIEAMEEAYPSGASPSEIVEFGKNAYSQTPDPVVAEWTTKFLREQEKYQEAISFGKSAHNDEPSGKLAFHIASAMISDGQLQQAEDFAKSAYNETEFSRVAERAVQAMLNSGSPANAADYGKTAFEQTPGMYLKIRTVQALNNAGNYTEAVEWGTDASLQISSFTAPLVESMKNAPDSVTETALTKIIDENGWLPDMLAPVVDQLPADTKQTIAQKIVRNHVDDVLSRDFDTKEGFRSALEENESYREMCSTQFRIDIWKDIKIGVVGEFEGWQAVVIQAKTMIQEL